LPGTDLAVGNSACPEEARDEDDGFVFDWVAGIGSLRATREAAFDGGLETLSLFPEMVRGCCRADAPSDSAIG